MHHPRRKRVLQALLIVSVLALGLYLWVYHTPSLIAAAYSPAWTRALLGLGADPNCRSDKRPWHSPLEAAARNGNIKVMQLLLAHGAKVNGPDGQNGPLYWAIMYETSVYPQEPIPDDKSPVELLLDHGANVRHRYRDGQYSAVESAVNGYSEPSTVKRLLDHGAPIERALFYVEDHGTADMLIHYGADQHERDAEGRTPLFHAVLRRNPDLVFLFLEHSGDGKAEVMMRDNSAATPLHILSDAEVAETLLEYGADPNARDKDGQTPLHKVAVNTEVANEVTYRIADILLKYGANPLLPDKRGYTPLDCAHIRNDNAKLLALLEEAAKTAKSTPG